jgi:hypothetical protein
MPGQRRADRGVARRTRRQRTFADRALGFDQIG